MRWLECVETTDNLKCLERIFDGLPLLEKFFNGLMWKEGFMERFVVAEQVVKRERRVNGVLCPV